MPINFGLESYISYFLYGVAISAALLSIFWRPIVGIFYLLPLIPLQTLRYRINDLPLGESVVGIMLVAVGVGLWRQGRPIFVKTPWTKLICIYVVLTFASLCRGSVFLGDSFPLPGDPRFGVWQDYVVMPVLLLLVAAIQPTKRQMQAMIVIICLATLEVDYSFWGTVSGHDFSGYSLDLENLREGGGMGYAGTNGLAAFEAQATIFLLALAAFEKRLWLRSGYRALAAFSAICLMYSFSRGGYVALLVGWLFLGLAKQRTLLALLLVFLGTWTAIVPPAVQQRVMMSYDEQNQSVDHSAQTRISLWQDAISLVSENPAVGTGYDTYAYMQRQQRTDGVAGYYADTHNIYLKILVENGVLGLLLFLLLVISMFWKGLVYSRHLQDPFFASLALGFAGWVICSLAASFFGDRWTFLQVNGYLWVLGGLISHASTIEKSALQAQSTLAPEDKIAADIPLPLLHPASGVRL
jgi:O-antigen ligase